MTQNHSPVIRIQTHVNQKANSKRAWIALISMNHGGTPTTAFIFNADNLIEQSGFEGNEAVGDLGAFGNPDITELQGTDALELNAVA